MAGEKVNNYSQVDSNILALQLTADKTFKGCHQLSLTEYATTTVPAIAAGSAIECNGTLYKFDTEEAISTTDPVTSATVADGTVYIVIVPGATTATAAFTATAPTWSDSKQGWYGTGGQANYRYAEFVIYKLSGAYEKEIRINKNINKFASFYMSAASVKLSGNFSLTGGTDKIPFNTEIYDYNSEFDTTNYNFTAKYTGLYLINIGGYIEQTLSGLTDSRFLFMYKNNIVMPTGLHVSFGMDTCDAFDGHSMFSGSSVVLLSQGDYIDFRLQAGSSGGTLFSYTCLTITKL